MAKNVNSDNAFLIKLAQKREEALDMALKKIAELTEEGAFMADEIGKLDGEKSALENQNKELTSDNEALAAEVANKVEEVVTASTDPVTTDSIDESMKEALVDMVGTALDQDLAGTLQDAISTAEDEQNLDGTKLASIMTSILSTYASQVNRNPMGNTITKSASKSNGTHGLSKLESKMHGALDKALA